MGVTYLADAVEGGAEVYADCRADRLVVENDRVARVECSILDRTTGRPTGVSVTIRPRITVSSAGAINAPALLLRSGIDDGPVGRRTFLHPVVTMPAMYEHRIEGFYGAPQSMGSHQFIERGPDRVGFFMETPPLQPMLASSGSFGFGIQQQELMAGLPHLGVLIALSVDGLLPQDDGGTVSLANDGRIVIDYPIRDFLIESFREAHKAMAQIELAAGALGCSSTHVDPVMVLNEADISKLDDAPYGALEHSIFSAHQMGGCTMGPDPATKGVRSTRRT